MNAVPETQAANDATPSRSPQPNMNFDPMPTMPAPDKFKILRATHLGMCFGVRDAIDLALSQHEPVTILGDLVHNEAVLQQLRSQGVKIQHQVADVATANVM